MSFGETFAAFGSLGDAYRQSKQRDALGALGAQIQGGDYAGAAKAAFEAGDPGTGLGLLKLGQVAQLEAHKQAFAQDFSNGLGAIMGGGAVNGAEALGVQRQSSSAPAVPSFLDTSSPSGQYTAGLIRRESNGVASAKNPNSSATGLGQFTTGTWKAVAAAHPELGLTPDGRTDPEQSIRAIQAHTADNERILNRSNLPVNNASLYSLHLLGQGGGPRFVAGAMRNPDAPAASFANPDQVRANRRIFYNADGSPKSAGQVMADFGRSFGGGGSAPTRQAQAAPAPGPVAYANNEEQARALEAQMGMVPPPSSSRQVASADPRADMPMPGAQNAEFRIPGGDTAMLAPPAPGLSGAGTASGRPVQAMSLPSLSTNAPAPVSGSSGRVMTMPGEGPAPSQVAAAQVPQDATVGRQPVGAIQASPLGQRIPFLIKALSSPYMETGQREVASMLLKQALDETKAPESVKEFTWARANGMTQARTPNEYAAEVASAKRGPQVVAPGSYVFQDGQFIGSAPDRSKDEGAKVRDVNAARREEAIAAGLDPNSPQGRAYILGGKIGADRDLSAGDRKAINEAEDHAVQLDQTIETLSRAKELNDKTFTGVTAGIRGKIGTTVPGAGYILDQKSAEATREFNQIMSMEAIKAMSSTLKGATTDREMERFMDILGDPSTAPSIRANTINRMMTLAQRQKELAQARIGQMREGTYYRPGGGASGGGDAARQPAARQNAPQSAPGDRFGQLIGSGMTKAQAYEQMQREGF